MGRIMKCGLFDGYARLALIDLTDIVNEEIKIHDLSPLATAALGRSMLAGAYVGNNLKSDDNTYSVTINGGGPLGPIVVAGGYGKIRGYVTDNKVNLPLKQDGHLDVGGGVGKDGYISVVKDLGLKDPYVGRSELISGEIAEDFTSYFAESEQTPSACALGVLVDTDGTVKAAGGYVIQLLPGAPDELAAALEQSVLNVGPVTSILESNSAEELINLVLIGFEPKILEHTPVEYRCYCSRERVRDAISGIDRKELDEMAAEGKPIEVTCQFCDAVYTFDPKELLSDI